MRLTAKKTAHTAITLVLLVTAFAATAQNAPTIAGIPGPLTWVKGRTTFTVDKGSALTLSAGPKTDWFVDPFEGTVDNNAPILAFLPPQNYVFSAKVQVKFATKWDAGALMLWADDHHWAKFSFELSPGKQPTVVTVVTRGFSDDCNSIPIVGDAVYLQIARKKSTYVFYYGTDGKTWNIVRTFNLRAAETMRVGFESQSPAGNGAASVFSEIHYSPQTIVNTYTGK